MAIYPRWRFDSPQLWEWFPLVVLVLLLGLTWHCRNRGTRGAFLPLAYFIVALLPVIGFVRMAYLRSGTLVADHFQYFADVSLIAFVCSAVAMFARRARGKHRKDRKSTRLNSSHSQISYAVFCLKKKKK